MSSENFETIDLNSHLDIQDDPMDSSISSVIGTQYQRNLYEPDAGGDYLENALSEAQIPNERSSEENFQEVLLESREGLEELNFLYDFVDKISATEAEYCQRLEILTLRLPKREETDFPEIWEILNTQLAEKIQTHREFGLTIGNTIGEALNVETKEQTFKLDLIEKEVNDSFADYQGQINELKNRSKNRPESADNGQDIREIERSHRVAYGKFERRRKVQAGIINSALKRFLELRTNNILNVVKYFRLYPRALYRFIVNLDHEKCMRSIITNEECCRMAKLFSWENKYKEVYDYWKTLMAGPKPILFHNALVGDLPHLTFGVDLVDYLNISEASVPPFLEKAVKEIEYRGLKTMDIYSLHMDFDVLHRIGLEYEKDSTYFPWNSLKIEIVAGLIKKYLKDLPVTIFPESFQNALQNISKHDKQNYRVQKLAQVFEKLPSEHVNTLKFVLDHLQKVSTYAHVNKMTKDVLIGEFSKLIINNKMSSTTESANYAEIILRDLMDNCDKMFASCYSS